MVVMAATASRQAVNLPGGDVWWVAEGEVPAAAGATSASASLFFFFLLGLLLRVRRNGGAVESDGRR
uniref:Uncharacterized protein n=1 Tax=Oryza barthii TaxID=65489 RepID=A0A0D3FT35_9ORYZ